jgi:hypothetical protein
MNSALEACWMRWTSHQLLLSLLLSLLLLLMLPKVPYSTKPTLGGLARLKPDNNMRGLAESPLHLECHKGISGWMVANRCSHLGRWR